MALITHDTTDYETSTPKYSLMGKEVKITNTIKDMQMFEGYGDTIKWKNEQGEYLLSDVTSSYFTFGSEQGLLTCNLFCY